MVCVIRVTVSTASALPVLLHATLSISTPYKRLKAELEQIWDMKALR